MELGEDVNRARTGEISQMRAGQSGLKIDIHIKGVVLVLEPLQLLLGVLLVDMELRRNLRIGIGLQLLRIPAHLGFDVRILGLQRDRNIDAATLERLDLRLDLTQILSDEPQTDILTVTDAVHRIQVGETLLEIGTLKTGRFRDRTLLQLLNTVIDLAKHLDGTLVLVKVEPVPVVPLHGGHVGLKFLAHATIRVDKVLGLTPRLRELLAGDGRGVSRT